MSIKTRIAALTLAALVATGSIAATATSAEARDFHGEHGFQEDHDFHHGWGWRRDGFHDESYYYSGYSYCHWMPRFVRANARWLCQ
jgi:hypothetical protein